MGRTNDSIARDLGRVEGKLDAIGAAVSDMQSRVVGNGREGVVERLARIEENLEDASRVCGENSRALDGVVVSVGELTTVVRGHVTSTHFMVLLRKKETWGAMLAAALALHYLFTYAPTAVAWLLALAGVPVPAWLTG